MESIITKQRDICFRCGARSEEVHHVIHGTANRQNSEKYGLKVPLCRKCHETVHSDIREDNILKGIGQTVFEHRYPELNFIEIFGKNYKLPAYDD